jgi:hypothetical protein
VHGSQTTELEKSLELGDWRAFIVNHLKDPIQTKEIENSAMIAELGRSI